MKKTDFKSLISRTVRIQGFRCFHEQVAKFFNARVSLIIITKKSLNKAKIHAHQLKQNIVLSEDGCTMYATIADVEEQLSKVE